MATNIKMQYYFTVDIRADITSGCRYLGMITLEIF